ncbi:cystatin-B-like isoform X1 [Hyperolius riggenbachi]|uniref:cystatin-B-like isoform X1 n=2 Tax=Hyperolius riggenbachi TaxID=752182 RepID=UPI0035A334D5
MIRTTLTAIQCLRSSAMPRCGGLGNLKPANQKVQNICNTFKEQVTQKSGLNFDTFQAVSYKTQVVQGTNYFIKVHVGGDQYLHLRIYDNLPCYNEEMSLTAFQVGKTEHEEIVHFEPKYDDDDN